MNVELILDTKCIIGEGPVWDERTNTLYFIDLLGSKIYSFDGVELQQMKLSENLGAAVVREKGGLLAVTVTGYHEVDFPNGDVRKIVDPEEKRENSRFNDGKCDAKGRFWAGTMSRELDSGYGNVPPESALWCLETDGTVSKKLGNVIQGNGMVWSCDNRTMYFIDSQRYTVQAFDFDLENGAITNGRIVIEIPRNMGMPDGMTIDQENHLWICLWGGGAVTCWDPKTGDLLKTIKIPAKNVTACTFGGIAMDELYITTASLDTDSTVYPNAGGVFRIKMPISGVPSYRFQG